MPTVDCKLWTSCKMETAEYRLFEYIQSNLDYPYLLGRGKIVLIIEGQDN